jgi:hypothetical protein
MLPTGYSRNPMEKVNGANLLLNSVVNEFEGAS